MTHPIYSQTTQEALTTAQLKTIANQLGAIPDGDILLDRDRNL